MYPCDLKDSDSRGRVTVDQLSFRFDDMEKPISATTEQFFLDKQVEAEKKPSVIAGKSGFVLKVAEGG
jgi:hypothetical protein